MVKIRLTRTGKKHEPHYRIVAVDSRKPRDGKYIEKIGYYNPRTKPPTLEYDKDILQKWIDSGAQMTDTVYDMFVKEGVIKQSGKRKARLALITKPEEKKAAEGDEEETTEKPSKKENKAAEADEEPSKEEKPEKEAATEEPEKQQDSKKDGAEKKEEKPKEAEAEDKK